jgi:predicted O-linked N-acetylglucosamine transferase (SPINDLY family)
MVRASELNSSGLESEAEGLLREQLTHNPNDAAAMYSLAVILLRRDELASQEAALALTTHGTTVGPGPSLLWALHGQMLQSLGLLDEALAAWDRALEFKPDYVEILLNSSALLRKLHRHADVLMRVQRLLALNPQHKAARGNSAILLSEFKQTAAAIAAFERLLDRDYAYDYGLGLLLYEWLHLCDWTGYDELSAQIAQKLADGKRTCKSLAVMAVSDDPAAKEWLSNGEVYRHDRIRLAHHSADLREHPVWHMVTDVIERHDKRRYHARGVAIGVNDCSRLRQPIEAAFETFVDVRGWCTRQIAQWLHDQEIDVVIDPGGYTSDARSDVLVMKPVPVQVNWLGYPGTMGVQTMDYILADRHVIPPGDERVVRLPNVYLPTDASLPVAERMPTRAECGLPKEGFVFCCFNHDYRIGPSVFSLWLRLLQQLPGYVLWLMSRNESSRAKLQAAAAAAGVDPARPVFAGRVQRVEDHLARRRVADLFLDTHPYNAHTTAADALMAGLPLRTRRGRSFPSRVAADLVTEAGVPELVTEMPEQYEALARDPARLAALKARVARARTESPMFDTAGFRRDLVAAVIAMWRRTRLSGADAALAA